jgi:transcription antitermination protein NusB
MELLYEAETKTLSVAAVIDELPLPPADYASKLALGAAEHVARSDELIRKFARSDWPLERMPMLDRIVMRMAVYELLEEPEIDRGVILNEAVELAKRFSTDDSHRYVNGMLTSIANDLGR